MSLLLIVYDSRSGNTEKMAHAVVEGAKTVENITVTLKNVDDARIEDLLEADGFIIGSPTYYGLLSDKIKAFIDKSVKLHGKLEGKIGAAFTSSGGVASGAETTIISIIQALLVHGMIVQGRSSGNHYGAAAVGAPDEKELESCRDLGSRTAKLVLRCKDAD